MRKMIFLILAGALLLACAPAVTTVPAPTSATLALAPADAYARSVRELASMGYQVVAGDPAAGFLRAEKPRRVWTGASFYDIMSLSFASVAGQTTVHMATSTDEATTGGRRPAMGISRQLEKDAQAMLARLQGGP